MGFSRQEYCSGLPCPSPGDLPNPGTEPRSLTVQADTLPFEPPGKSIGFLSRLKFSSLYIFGLVSWNECKSHPNLSQTSSHKGCFRTHITPHPCLKIANPWKISHCDLTCISMITNESKHVFMCLCAIHGFSFLLWNVYSCLWPIFLLSCHIGIESVESNYTPLMVLFAPNVFSLLSIIFFVLKHQLMNRGS